MRNGDDAHNSFAMQYEAWLDGKSKWPCMNPDCGGWVDPDDEYQYCTKSCEAKCVARPDSSHHIRQYHKLKTSADWVRRNATNLNSQIPIEASRPNLAQMGITPSQLIPNLGVNTALQSLQQSPTGRFF